jgi:hypothetical protein
VSLEQTIILVLLLSAVHMEPGAGGATIAEVLLLALLLVCVTLYKERCSVAALHSQKRSS